MAGPLHDGGGGTTGTGAEALEGGALVGVHLCHVQIVTVELQVVFRIGNGGVQELEDGLSGYRWLP